MLTKQLSPRLLDTINSKLFRFSENKDNWGTPILEGSFSADQSEKRVAFQPVRARYVRLVALSEITGGDWASIAELDLVEAEAL